MLKTTSLKKLKAVKDVLELHKSINNVASENGCSRQTIYLWINKFKNSHKTDNLIFKSKYKKGQEHHKKLSWRIEKLVLDLAIKNPGLSLREITQKISSESHKVSLKGVFNILSRYGLQKKELRYRFSLNHPVKTVFASAMVPSIRAKIISEFTEQGKPISTVCKVWNISRPTFYAWLKRYKDVQAIEGGVFDTEEALSRNYKTGYRHHRSVGEHGRDVVLGLVAENPEYSVHKLFEILPRQEGKPVIGHHAVQNILLREDLNTVEKRLRFAAENRREIVQVAPLYAPDIPVYRLRQILAPFKTVPRLVWLFTKGRVALVFIALFGFYLFKVFSAIILPKTGTSFGNLFASISLTFGIFFFVYSMKYYLSTLLVLQVAQNAGNPYGKSMSFILKLFGKRSRENAINPLHINLAKVELSEKPFVSIHVALYNEKRVVERLIKATTGQDYKNYEVIIADDSTDETTEIAKEILLKGGWKLERTVSGEDLEIYVAKAEKLPTVKLIHRFTRSGYKGAALQVALENTDPKADYITIFDADFVPFADTIEQFMKSFQEVCLGFKNVKDSKIAAVQGYQWHVLNKSQNWITRGVRTEYAGSYVVERAGEQVYGGLKQISGSVYCIRADVLRQFGWGSSITEDFELTLRLYEAGYKVAFTPYIQAPAEAVSTIKRLIRQRMRWAEGASFNVKVMLPRMLRSPHMTGAEKFEFAYLSPYYLQAAFFVVGTLSWFLSEAVLGAKLPFWTAAFGWSLVFTNLFALPLMNIIGMFLEDSDERDYVGILSFIVLSYIVVPFQAYAAIKGFFENSEGPWFRTPKTGTVTDVFDRSQFGRFFGNLFGRPSPKGFGTASRLSLAMINTVPLPTGSAFNWFGNSLAVVPNLVPRSPGKLKWYGRAVLVLLLLFSVNLLYFSRGIPVAEATNMAGPLKLDLGQADQSPGSWSNQLDNSQSYASSSTLIPLGNMYANANTSSNKYFWLSNLLPTGGPDAVIPGGNYWIQFAKQGNGTAAATVSTNTWVQLWLTSSNGVGRQILQTNSIFMRQNNTPNTLMQFSIGNLVGNNITSAAKNRFAVSMFYDNGPTSSPNCRTNTNCYWNMAINNTNLPARLIIPSAGITVPEIPKPVVLAILLVVMPVLPAIVSGRYRKKGRNVVEEFGVAWKDLIRKLLGQGDEVLDELPV